MNGERVWAAEASTMVGGDEQAHVGNRGEPSTEVGAQRGSCLHRESGRWKGGHVNNQKGDTWEANLEDKQFTKRREGALHDGRRGR